ncbi:MAG: B12-binding domain-containing radical SAM protein [Actinobacteria bacterium]|nr:B12-binding domain-containing radical SAM protein [Actinomycetota bacterium]
MKVLFVHSEQDPYSHEKPLEILERVQFGISYISALLKREGHETRLVVLCGETVPRVVEAVEEFDPGLVCFTSVFTEFGTMSRAAALVKKSRPDVFTLLGGPHATLRPDDCLAAGPFDAVCVGEGEYPTLELVEMLEAGRFPSGIANLHIRKPGGGVERNAPRPFLEDLDALPFPDREMWMPWVANPVSRPSILVGRGCPFNCTYCCNHALRKAAPGRYVRLRSPENIARELVALKEAEPTFAEAYLEVETLGVDREWAAELCAELKKANAGFAVPVSFGANLRVTPNADYEGLFAALSDAGFRFVNIGLESGSERIRREVLNRRYSNRDIIGAVETARRHGMQVGIYNLIGLPGETPRDFRDTVEVNRACQPDWFLLSVFFPYPGTKLHEKCRELGLLDKPLDSYMERRRPVLDLPGFSKRQVGRRRDWFPFMVYRGRRPVKELLWLVAMAKIYSNHRLADVHRRLMERRHARNGRDFSLSPEMAFLGARSSAGEGKGEIVEAELASSGIEGGRS